MMKILVADDDPLIVQLLRTGLRAQGWNVLVAADAMQVGMFAMSQSPDAILLDINMPGGTGVAALKRLKQSVKTSQIPVVVLSGTTDPQIPDTVRAMGAEAFLPKPVDLDEVIRLLCELLGVAPK
ncbi:MAG TPA: response regulator [Longimicrobium sp.]|jgi:DNA-binding response OmpR family regulator